MIKKKSIIGVLTKFAQGVINFDIIFGLASIHSIGIAFLTTTANLTN